MSQQPPSPKQAPEPPLGRPLFGPHHLATPLTTHEIDSLRALLEQRQHPTTTPFDLLTIRQAGDLAGIRRNAIDKRIKSGKLKRYGWYGAYRVSWAELMPPAPYVRDPTGGHSPGARYLTPSYRRSLRAARAAQNAVAPTGAEIAQPSTDPLPARPESVANTVQQPTASSDQ